MYRRLAALLYFIAAPELQVRSDWERHSLTADITGSYTEYVENLVPSLNVPYLNAKIDGRVDVTRDTQILLDQRFLINTDNPGSPNLRTNLQAQLAQLPLNFDVGETVGVAQQFNRLSFSLRGTFDRSTYDNRSSPTARLRATPTVTSTNMPASCVSAMSSTRAEAVRGAGGRSAHPRPAV